jgi:putative endonuclease
MAPRAGSGQDDESLRACEKNAKSRKIGIEGETLVARYLASLGWAILARNWRTRRGEIDIIARESDVLVFVEVKTWPHGEAAGLDLVIGYGKQRRMVETAKCFLDTHRQYNGMYIRFDVILVDSGIHHLKDAFSERVE